MYAFNIYHKIFNFTWHKPNNLAVDRSDSNPRCEEQYQTQTTILCDTNALWWKQ